MKKAIIITAALLITALQSTAQIAINPTNALPDPSAGLDVQYSNKGVLIPRMTMAERDAIVNPANGLMIICTDCGEGGALNIYLNGTWKATSFSTSSLAAPVAGTHVPSATQIVWNWGPVTGATGYKWGTTNNFSTATDVLLSTSKTETGLTCNTNYVRYIWAYNSTAVSPVTAIVQMTSTCGFSCGNTLTINHVAGSVAPVNKTVAYGTVTNIPGEPSKCWITSNLGASQQATAVNDATEASAGWYWQFNRMQGFKHDGTTRTPNTTWINNINENSDWISANDPCTLLIGTSWRIPNYTEFYNINSAGGWTNWNGPWASSLRLHAAGYLFSSNGVLDYRGTGGFYWSSTQISNNIWGYDLWFNSTLSNTYSATKTYGFPLRCLKDCAPSSPTTGTHTPSQTQIIWNWNTVTDATGYKWNTSNNYSTATDMGTLTTYTETGLTCNTEYTRYVWAYNDCGYSTPTTLTQSTSACPWSCGQSITINHVAGNVAPVNKTVTYGTVTNIPGETSKCWITSNLGASQQATAVNDATEASAGWYWQFNRMQGYKHDGTTRTPNTVWITSIDENSDWQTTNDPCTIELGNGWRIPSSTEWTNVDVAGNWTDWNGPWNSALKIHAAGFLNSVDGSLYSRGLHGDYYSSLQNTNTFASQMGFGNNYSYVYANDKAYSRTLRCVKD